MKKIIILLLLSSTIITQAQPIDKISQIAKVLEISKKEVDMFITKDAIKKGKTKQEMIEIYYQETQQFLKDSQQTSKSQQRSINLSGPEKDKTQLTTSTRVGDVFYTDNTTVIVNHGHTGIYIDKNNVIHAPGKDDISQVQPISKIQVAKNGTKIMHVYPNENYKERAGLTTLRHDVANFALKHFKDKEYDLVFIGNKDIPKSLEKERNKIPSINGEFIYLETIEQTAKRVYENKELHKKVYTKDTFKDIKLNCSELVWKSYLFGAGIDIDNNDVLPSVYPIDIVNSKKTKIYKEQ